MVSCLQVSDEGFNYDLHLNEGSRAPPPPPFMNVSCQEPTASSTFIKFPPPRLKTSSQPALKWWRCMAAFKRPGTSLIRLSQSALILSTRALQYTPHRKTYIIFSSHGGGEGINTFFFLRELRFLPTTPPKGVTQTCTFICWRASLWWQKNTISLLLPSFDSLFFPGSVTRSSSSRSVSKCESGRWTAL